MASESNVVMVVEDEPIIRLNAAVLFEDAGFEVIEASTAGAALALLEKCDGQVAALFTDVDMPGDMNGLELAGMVHTRWPQVALVITSGVVRPDVLPRGGVFLEKPYTMSSPVRLLRAQIRDKEGQN